MSSIDLSKPLSTIAFLAFSALLALSAQAMQITKPEKDTVASQDSAALEQREFRQHGNGWSIDLKCPELPDAAELNLAVRRKLDSMVKSFKGGLSSETTNRDYPGSDSYLTGTYKFELLENGIVSILLNYEIYVSGSAHPGGELASLNYDRRDHRLLALSDLFRPKSPYLQRLSKIAIHSLEQNEYADTFAVHRGAAPVESNFRVFTFTHSELIIHFQTYQVAAGAAGQQQVAIPLASLAPLLKERLAAAVSGAPQQQTPKSASAKATAAYDVVSIKPSKPGTQGVSLMSPNGFRDTDTTIGMLLRSAFGIFYDKQIVGLLPWTDTDLYDVEAKVDADTANRWHRLTSAERRKEEQPMMQALLIDRCKLNFHFETKELSVYDLVIAKSGSKMKQAPQDEVETSEIAGGDGVTLTAHALSMERFIPTLSGTDGRLVVDKTGLGDKKFDFTLHWSPGAGSGPSLFTALEEQLGLKLVPSKEPVNVLVLDRIEKPSAN